METMGEIADQIVLDTNCLIELEKGNLSVIESLDENSSLYITSITVFEFALGDLFDENENRLEDYVVIPFHKHDGLLTAKISKELKKSGKEVEFRDVMIASICINNKLPLLTKNKKHFERFLEYGLRLVDDKIF